MTLRDADTLETGEIQARLPHAGAVRDLEIATPHALELPTAGSFELTPPKETTETQCSLFTQGDNRS